MGKIETLKYLRMIIKSSIPEPYWGLPKIFFDDRVYRKWAVEEVLKAIEKSDLPPILVVEDFAKKMDDYSCMAKRSSIMFATAYDTAEWILDILLSAK